jgi:hypothetical protein
MNVPTVKENDNFLSQGKKYKYSIMVLFFT